VPRRIADHVWGRVLTLRIYAGSLTMILFTSVLHIGYGMSVILMSSVPRPFGNLEPLFAVLPVRVAGVVLVMCALLPFVGIVWPGRHWARWCSAWTVPQEMILFWSATWAMHMLLERWDGRTFLSGFFLFVLAAFHTRDVLKLHELMLLYRKVDRRGVARG
jgi:hypothetical protein